MSNKKLVAMWGTYIIAIILQIIAAVLPKSAKHEAHIILIVADVFLLVFLVIIIKGLWDDHKRHKKYMADLDESYQRIMDSLSRATGAYNKPNPAKQKQAVADLNKKLKEGMKNGNR